MNTGFTRGGRSPKFRHANQIKRYLKESGINRDILVSKHKDYMHIYEEPQYTVYVSYTREELKAINPNTPDKGDPFVVEHPKEEYPEFICIERLLDGSNTSLLVLGPERDPEDK